MKLTTLTVGELTACIGKPDGPVSDRQFALGMEAAAQKQLDADKEVMADLLKALKSLGTYRFSNGSGYCFCVVWRVGVHSLNCIAANTAIAKAEGQP